MQGCLEPLFTVRRSGGSTITGSQCQPPSALHAPASATRPAAKRLKPGGRPVDVKGVKLEKCPYDMSPIAVQYAGDSFVISCETCGAAWEMRSGLMRRFRAPDSATIKAVRESLFPPDLLGSDRAAATETAENALR